VGAQLREHWPNNALERGSALTDDGSRETFQNADGAGLIKGSMQDEGAHARPMFHVKQSTDVLRSVIKTG
jgi:hypothetical protein